MDDNTETALKQICCTCLSVDRKLSQLCRLTDGVNNLYLLLSYDSEAYREGFYKDTASLFICWECRAIMIRISQFRHQACTAQRQLTSIGDGRIDIKSQAHLSQLSTTNKAGYDKIYTETDSLDNFIDCGLNNEIKEESEEDIPLSELHSNWQSDNETVLDLKIKKGIKKRKKLKKEHSYSQYYTIVSMNETDLNDVMTVKKMAGEYVDSKFKCDSCILKFQDGCQLDEHNSTFHVEKPHHIQCDICQIYIKKDLYQDHKQAHFKIHSCLCCEYVVQDITDMFKHLEEKHDLILNNTAKKKKGRRKPISRSAVEDLSSEKKECLADKRMPFGYLCKECNKCFENKNQRWKHVQRHHREGYKCSTCSKRFAFRNNLTRHEQLHQGPPPRTECAVCHKQIRVDLLKVHSRIHSDRQQYSCVECAKSFVSRASYEHHLKYTQAHAATDVLKYKCSMCDKGYRSRGELRDHVNYQHMGKTQHKCPICGKALATRRCITRHVRRTHDGVKESARDKICQQCGKAFRDKKGLREHELIHTGERPLSCELCGCTFRQSASLYTHKKRVHKIYPPAKRIQLLT